MIMPEYEEIQQACPNCGHEPIRIRACMSLHCEDGYIDEYEDDPINFTPGESLVMCVECYGTGAEQWCPECGYDIAKHDYLQGGLE